MGVKRENDENEAQNSNFLKKAAKSSKFDKGKGKAVSKVTEVSEAAAEATLSKRQLEFLKGFYTNSITSTKTIDEVDIPWYMEEALPFYPETLDEADTAGFQLKRDRTLLFIESQQNIDRIRLFDNCSNEDKEIEVFPPEKRQLNLTVRPIFKNSDEVSFKPPGPFHVRMQNITLTHSLDSNMEMVFSL